VNNIEIQVKTGTKILLENPISLIKSIIEREATFNNNSNREVIGTLHAFVNNTQRIHNEYAQLSTRLDKPRTDGFPCVRYVCPILNA